MRRHLTGTLLSKPASWSVPTVAGRRVEQLQRHALKRSKPALFKVDSDVCFATVARNRSNHHVGHHRGEFCFFAGSPSATPLTWWFPAINCLKRRESLAQQHKCRGVGSDFRLAVSSPYVCHTLVHSARVSRGCWILLAATGGLPSSHSSPPTHSTPTPS